MTDLLKDLEAVTLLADKATPGEWRAWDDLDGDYAKVEGSPDGPNIANTGRLGWPEAKYNAAYITALSNLFRTHHAEIAEALRDARRWRHARKILPVEYIEGSQREFESYGLPGSEEENIAADNAIDAAMHNSARENGK